MTNEQRKTAIEWLQQEIRSLRLAPKINGCGPENWADLLEIMETCLEAVMGHGYEPLTLDQLLWMDGEPVWVEFEDGSGGSWGIVHKAVFNQIIFANGLHCTIGYPYYGKTYKAYVYPPAHIDREAWTSCECNNGKKNCCTCVSMQCHFCVNGSEYNQGSYCSACGRPLTPEAWAEMEKRLRGEL